MKRRSKVQENLKSSSPGLFWGAPPAHADIINFVATYKSEACEQKLYVTFNFILKGIMTLPSNHSSWWRRLSPSSSEDVFIKTNIFALVLRLQKTSWSRSIYSSWSYVFKTSSRCLARMPSRFFERRIIWLNCLPSSRICLGHTSEKFMVSVGNLQVWYILA